MSTPSLRERLLLKYHRHYRNDNDWFHQLDLGGLPLCLRENPIDFPPTKELYDIVLSAYIERKLTHEDRSTLTLEKVNDHDSACTAAFKCIVQSFGDAIENDSLCDWISNNIGDTFARRDEILSCYIKDIKPNLFQCLFKETLTFNRTLERFEFFDDLGDIPENLCLGDHWSILNVFGFGELDARDSLLLKIWECDRGDLLRILSSASEIHHQCVSLCVLINFHYILSLQSVSCMDTMSEIGFNHHPLLKQWYIDHHKGFSKRPAMRQIQSHVPIHGRIMDIGRTLTLYEVLRQSMAWKGGATEKMFLFLNKRKWKEGSLLLAFARGIGCDSLSEFLIPLMEELYDMYEPNIDGCVVSKTSLLKRVSPHKKFLLRILLECSYVHRDEIIREGEALRKNSYFDPRYEGWKLNSQAAALRHMKMIGKEQLMEDTWKLMTSNKKIQGGACKMEDIKAHNISLGKRRRTKSVTSNE